MPNLSLKNVSEELVERLPERARHERRSLNQQAIVCLGQSLRGRVVEPDQILARINRLLEDRDLPPLTDELLARARSGGRP